MALTLEDRIAVQDLMVRYAYVLDMEGNEDSFLALFTEDATLESPVSGIHTGAEGARQFLKKANARRSQTQIRHIITNFMIDGEGDRATIKAYFIETMTQLQVIYPKSECSTEFLYAGYYDCVARKIGGQWKLQRRIVNVDARPARKT